MKQNHWAGCCPVPCRLGSPSSATSISLLSPGLLRINRGPLPPSAHRGEQQEIEEAGRGKAASGEHRAGPRQPTLSMSAHTFPPASYTPAGCSSSEIASAPILGRCVNNIWLRLEPTLCDDTIKLGPEGSQTGVTESFSGFL